MSDARRPQGLGNAEAARILCEDNLPLQASKLLGQAVADARHLADGGRLQLQIRDTSLGMSFAAGPDCVSCKNNTITSLRNHKLVGCLKS